MGFRISTEVGPHDVDMVWAAIAVAALAGSVFYGLVALVERATDLLASVLSHADVGRFSRTAEQSNEEDRGTRSGMAMRRCRFRQRARPRTSVTMQLKWVTQAQFAGYYVAKDKGFYKDAGLDVTIKPGGPDVTPPQVIAGGGADVVVDWMPSALATREKGVPLVNIPRPSRTPDWS